MSSPAGVIHDIGYRRYTGERLGRGYATWSLYTHSLRSAFGLGRGVTSKLSPWGLSGVLMLIAAIVVAIQSQVGVADGRLLEYYAFPNWGGLVNLFVLIFVAIAAPELVSRDLRGGVLPLYFSRPINRLDYPLAKWAAVVSAVFLALLGPELLLFLGTAFLLDDVADVWSEFQAFSQGVATSAITAAVFGSIALLFASISGRRAVATAITVGFFILTTPVWLVLQVIAYTNTGPDGELTARGLAVRQLSGLASPFNITDSLVNWLFNPDFTGVGPYGPVYLGATAGIVVLCLLLTLLRYWKVAR